MAIYVDMTGEYGYLQQMLVIRCDDMLKREGDRGAQDVEWIRSVAELHVPVGAVGEKKRGDPCIECGDVWPCPPYLGAYGLTGPEAAL